jgi:hypothetical protein
MKLKGFFYLSLALFSGLLLAGCTNDNASNNLKKVTQNIFDLIDVNNPDEPLISAQVQNKLYLDYLQHYFSPWTGTFLHSTPQQILETTHDTIKSFMANPGWGENKQPHTINWIKDIINNMQMSIYPNAYWKGITVRNTAMRLLPTDDPSFDNWNKAGQGYPFDNLQISNVKNNTPVLILHESKDKLWALVLTHDAMGWISLQAIAKVNDKFIQKWQTSNFLAVSQENTIVTNINNNQNLLVQIGTIFPYTKCKQNRCHVLLASPDDKNNAVIFVGIIPVDKVTLMPFSLTEKHVALLINALLGEPYGWGGYNGYRDCSSTMQDIFAAFGIWLPRNSSEQMKQGNYIKLSGLTTAEKLKKIYQHGLPFLTLIHLPGHIMLYLGKYDNSPYVFQTVWGLHTRNIFFQEGRAIIGQTIIAPINLGYDLINISSTWLDSADSMTILVDDKQSPN